MNGFFGIPKLSFLALSVSMLAAIHPGNMSSSAPPDWWTTHALVKVLPWDKPPNDGSRLAEIAAGKNEFEPFQIVLHATQTDIQVVDAKPTDLRGAGDARIDGSNVRIYVERYITLSRTSSGSQTSAEWPDPLIPRIDQYFQERRNAFPFRLSRGRNQPLWIEVYVPPSTPAGDYQGEVAITTEGGTETVVPVKLRVWDFTLPSTASYRTSFGLAGAAVLKQHRGKYTNDEDLEAITRLYAKAMLWHRVSFHGGTFHPPEVEFKDDKARIDWNRYDKEVAPFLNGTVFTKGEPLFGAKVTSIDLRVSNKAESEAMKVDYWRQWARHFEPNGWLDRLFFYVRDEPPRKELPKVDALARLAHKADPRLRTLVTTSLDKRLEDSIDIWTPLVNCMQSRPGFPDYCDHPVAREAYEHIVQDGKELWWYQSCASHGCKEGDDEYFRGWPSYVIDESAVANRIMPWISWKYAIKGELYYNVAEAEDPWSNIYLFGGNGDGTLFYPGKPDLIGGTNDIPLESIRLKLIREGIEDYEYMAMLGAQGRSNWTDQQVSSIVRSAYDWQNEPQKIYAVRKLLGETLQMVVHQPAE